MVEKVFKIKENDELFDWIVIKEIKNRGLDISVSQETDIYTININSEDIFEFIRLMTTYVLEKIANKYDDDELVYEALVTDIDTEENIVKSIGSMLGKIDTIDIVMSELINSIEKDIEQGYDYFDSFKTWISNRSEYCKNTLDKETSKLLENGYLKLDSEGLIQLMYENSVLLTNNKLKSIFKYSSEYEGWRENIELVLNILNTSNINSIRIHKDDIQLYEDIKRYSYLCANKVVVKKQEV